MKKPPKPAETDLAPAAAHSSHLDGSSVPAGATAPERPGADRLPVTQPLGDDPHATATMAGTAHPPGSIRRFRRGRWTVTEPSR